MSLTKIILIAGFGNLGAKLLALRWAFPYLRFRVLEDNWQYFQYMKEQFSKLGTLGDFLDHEPEDGNLKAFRAELLHVPGVSQDNLRRDYGSMRLGDMFDHHIYYCGPETEKASREKRAELIAQLLECTPDEVLLYLATRPEKYLWYLTEFGAFARRVAIDKPLAKDEQGLIDLERFNRGHPTVEIRPIDHYLFKLDFDEFLTALQPRGGSLDPGGVRRIDVTIEEHDPALGRPYFRETGIIRDMMPHVAAMVTFLFRNQDRLTVEIGNVAPLVRDFPEMKNVRIQAVIDLTVWAGSKPVPVGIHIGKAATENRKKIDITWETGQTNHIDLARRVEGREQPFADWAGALRYLMEVSPIGEAIGANFTFERACQVTRDILACNQQAEVKIQSGASFRKDVDGPVAIPSAQREVYVFNFDGVVICTEEAHRVAWETWHDVLGLEPPKDLTAASWYRPGRSNRQMVAEAAGLTGADSSHFGVQDADALFRVFSHILREEKLKFLRQQPLSPYHRSVLAYLRRLRQSNQILVMESTNDAALVKQSVELLFDHDPDAHLYTLGFDHYYVDRRHGLQTYNEIIRDYCEHRIVIFDDYFDALKALSSQHRDLVNAGHLRLIHMHTMSKSAVECRGLCEFGGYTDFDQVPADLASGASHGPGNVKK
jgi:hypothetical protein